MGPRLPDHRPDTGMSAEFDQSNMKGFVLPVDGAVVAGLRGLPVCRQNFPQLLQLTFRDASDRLLHGGAFQRHTREHRILNLVHVQARHIGADLRPNFDETFLGQADKRLAHGLPAGAEFFG